MKSASHTRRLAKKNMTYQSNNRHAKQRASRAKFSPNLNVSQRPVGLGQWQSRYEHYRNLAQQVRNADSITREHYWRHAEHFYRLMHGSAFEAASPSATLPVYRTV